VALQPETANSDAEAKRSDKPGPRVSPSMRDLLLKLLVAGEREGAINALFRSLGYLMPASSALAYYRERWRDMIDEARASRTERALTEGLALKAERVAKLREHAEVLDALRWVPDKNGRLWNERAYRQTLANIAEEMGERRPEGERTDRGSGQDGDRHRSRSRLN